MLAASECGSVWIFRRCVKEEGRLSTPNNSVNCFEKKNRRKVITCGLRSYSYKNKKKQPPSKESIQAVQALKLAKSSNDKLNQVLKSTLRRLLKHDVLDVLSELHRQNQLHLSLKVLEFMVDEEEEEEGNDTLLLLLLLQMYSETIQLLGRNKKVEMAEEVFSQAMKKGLKPDTRLFTEMIGVYLMVGDLEKAMEVYRTMKDSGCSPDKLTFTILISNVMKKGEHELARTLKQESIHYGIYLDY